MIGNQSSVYCESILQPHARNGIRCIHGENPFRKLNQLRVKSVCFHAILTDLYIANTVFFGTELLYENANSLAG